MLITDGEEEEEGGYEDKSNGDDHQGLEICTKNLS